MDPSPPDATGVLLLDKPAGPTSHDCVRIVRRAFAERRVGHTGTLDPFATGLLPICVGRATRLARFFTSLPKTYRATIRFGVSTDTYDVTGKTTGERLAIDWDEATLREMLAGFEGRQLQTPPNFSAKKVGGVRAHRLARQGRAATPEPVWVTISELSLLDWSGQDAVVDATVSSGTYIRSLAHDLGGRLGSGAHLAQLRRTQIGEFSVEDAVDCDALVAGSRSSEQPQRGYLLTPERAMASWPAIALSDEQSRWFIHGRHLDPRNLARTVDPSRRIDPAPLAVGEWVRLDGPRGQLLGLARWPEPGAALHAELVWARVDNLEPAASRS